MQSEELSPEELSTLLTSYTPDIPGYRVIRRIGKGGMSFVYLGVQISLDRQVAIKVMSPEALKDEKSKTRFEQEAHTIAKLEHPCIVGVHEVGRTPQGLLYYVLPYLARGHLGQRDFTNDEPRIIEVLRALLSALEYAHTRGIVHRDVKAENVLFDNADRPLLTDFGIALQRTDTSRITTAGLAVGSGGYMAPEQARGEAVDGRADLYSVGVLAYELLNGRLPYLSSDPLGLALMHAQDPIPRLPAERKHWQSFIDRAMAKSPDNRFRNAQQMLGALNQLAVRERAVLAAHEAAPQAPVVPLMQRPWLRPALFAVAAATILVMTVLLLRTPPAPVVASNDFFTGAEVTAAAEPPAANPMSAPTDAPEPGDDTGVAPVAAAEPVPQAAPEETPVVADPLPVETIAPYGAVEASVTSIELAFDPTVPGARELHAVPRQIKAKRLSTPAGDNAIESLGAARRAGAPAEDLTRLSDEVIAAMGKNIVSALAAGRDDTARTGYKRGSEFARESGRLKSEAWKKFREALVPTLVTRLDKSAQASDRPGFEATKALARTLEVPSQSLEPAWSRTIVEARPGKILRSNGPTTVLVQPGTGSRPGIAFMREEVSKADYAAFANATRRPTARCRNRLAPITIKKRTWSAPGFSQTDSHPAVCVSFEDARAYAQWLSARTGETYRLPTATEWRQIANYKGSGNACQDGRVDCGQDGTVPAGSGPASPLGLVGVRGNAREWLSDCAGSCRQHLVSGLGWRDNSGKAEPTRSSGFDASVGFDDVGFRLVREVSSN
ncbi:MAG: SUMF1/EgtB/PvdO family nonheme iron enzyme [Gammaproteobacteria bacterium]|nr:SUMF1/EgtB/PvdO family nonheme iron enzyme [Gammaproteobacteria bacterium]